jgi:hypothetical protein
LSKISKLVNLNLLYLQSTGVSDIAPLSGLRDLCAVNLEDTAVVDFSPLLEIEGFADRAADGFHSWLNTGNITDSNLERIALEAGDDGGTVRLLNYIRLEKGLPLYWPEAYSGTRDLPDSDTEGQEPKPTAGAYAVARRDDTLEADPTFGSPTNDNLAQDMLEALREHAQQIQETLVDNLADNIIITTINKLIDDIKNEPDQIPIGRLQISLRRLQNLAVAYSDSERESDLTLRGLLGGLADGLTDFVALYPAVKEIEASRMALGVISDGDLKIIGEQIEEFASIARASPLVGISVVQAITDGDNEIGFLSEILASPAMGLSTRASAIRTQAVIRGQQLITVWNFSVGALRWLQQEFGSVGSQSWDSFKSGIPDGIGKGTSEAIRGLVHVSLLALAVKLAGPLAPLAFVLPAFKALQRRAESVKDKSEEKLE